MLTAVPNVSEGRDEARLESLAAAIARGGARVLDLHRDADHGRSVFTVAGGDEELVRSMTLLSDACGGIDLRAQTGIHPRLGVLDVCPFVPLDGDMDRAVHAARAAGAAMGAQGHPVYLYGYAAIREATRELPGLRRGGLQGLIERSAELPPDHGPTEIDERQGVVCVGARGVLIAFNVWLTAGAAAARAIASKVRSSAGGPPGIRALGLAIGIDRSQVSMNLIEPEVTGVDAAFAAVEDLARSAGVEVTGTEIVGLPPARMLPDPDAKAARLLVAPSRSLESALKD